MSARVAYLERADRGGRLLGLRLIAGRGEASWRATPTGSDEDAAARIAEDAERAADWVREELGKGAKRELAAICLDPDGAVCSWLTTPTSDPSALAATLRQASLTDAGASPIDGGGMEHGLVAAAAFGPDAQIPGGATVEALGTNRDSGGALGGSAHAGAGVAAATRRAVISAPDTPARLFLDQLDRLGMPTPPVMTLWHAMARAWTPPEAPSDETQSVVLVEPSGRVAWCWSRDGALLAAGRLRLPAARLHDPAAAEQAISRLNTEWLAWSAQLGVHPSRLACVTPEPDEGDADSTEAPASEAPFADTLARGLRRAWPSAQVELATLRDPVGATLRQLLATDAPESAGDAAHGLQTLSARPGRAHRGMYRWLAAAIGAAAVLVALIGWRVRATARDARADAEALRDQRRDLLVEHDPRLERARRPIDELRSQLGALQSQSQLPSNVRPLSPVMGELDAVTLVLQGIEGVELLSLNFSQVLPQLEIAVPDVATYEAVRESLNAIPSQVESWTSGGPPSQQRVGGEVKLKAVFRGDWPDPNQAGGPL
ncbi:MAG: hypothetical protein AAGK04_03485 [Planctomycetota bacterium]